MKPHTHDRVMTHPRMEARLDLPEHLCIVDRVIVDEINLEADAAWKAREHTRNAGKMFEEIAKGLGATFVDCTPGKK